jgi:MoaA/NifB/PqqE/SkfB family radical SAM enzyme
MLLNWGERSPYSIHWDITNSCNYSCRHCAANGQCLDESSELSLDEIRRVVENLNTPRPIIFNIFGGEPLIRKDILAIIDLIKEKLRNSKIGITTNGSCLQQYARELLQRNVAITVSLDGISPEVNDKIRGKGTFHQIIGNLSYLVAQKRDSKDTKSKISIAYTITNYSEEPADILRFCEGLGVDRLVLSPIAPLGSALRNKYLLVETNRLIDYIERLYLIMRNTLLEVDANLAYPLFIRYFNAKYGADLAYRYVGCMTISTNFSLRPNGTFTACPVTYPGSEAFKALGLYEPSLIDKRLEDILQDEAFQRLLKLKNPGSYPNYKPCNECGFAGSYCDPCWIDGYLGKVPDHAMCRRIAGKLDEMHLEWRAR